MISKFKDTVLYKSEDKYIRSTKHNFNSYLNISKNDFIDKFIVEYRRVMAVCLKELYSKTYYWEFKGRNYRFNLRNRYFPFGLPSFFNTSKFHCLQNYTGFLSGRMLSNIVNQLCNVLKGELKSSKSLHHRFELPNIKNINPEIYPKHITMELNENENSIFKLYVTLLNFTKKRNENITIPIKLHKMDDKHSKKGILMHSILLTSTYIGLRYEFEGSETKDKQLVVGADTGIRKICSFSDGQTTPKENNQHKTYNDIEEKIYRKKHNTKAYRKAVNEMKCFTREVLNKIKLDDISTLKLESNKGIKTNTKNANKYWQREVINTKIKYMCQDSGCDLISTLSQFKSVRCPNCNYVHKNNRLGEKFKCKCCSYEGDADVVSSINNSIELPYVDLWVYRKIARTSGFFWSIDGIVVNDNNTGHTAYPVLKLN